LRKIFGPVQNEDGSWRIRMSYELNELIEYADTVRFIKSRRIAWLGHVNVKFEESVYFALFHHCHGQICYVYGEWIALTLLPDCPFSPAPKIRNISNRQVPLT
jgi:hypothetical protein